MRTRFSIFPITYHRLIIGDNSDLVTTRYAKTHHLFLKPLAWNYNAQIIEAMKRAERAVLEVCYDRKVFRCPLQYWTATKTNKLVEERGEKKNCLALPVLLKQTPTPE